MDKMFGSDQPRRVGEEWQGNAEVLAKAAQQSGAEVSPDDISGRATLHATRLVEGKTLLDLEFVTEAKVQRESPTPMAEPVSASANITQRLTMEQHAKQRPLSQTHVLELRQILRGMEGTPLEGNTLDGVSKETRKVTYKYFSE